MVPPYTLVFWTNGLRLPVIAYGQCDPPWRPKGRKHLTPHMGNLKTTDFGLSNPYDLSTCPGRFVTHCSWITPHSSLYQAQEGFCVVLYVLACGMFLSTISLWPLYMQKSNGVWLNTLSGLEPVRLSPLLPNLSLLFNIHVSVQSASICCLACSWPSLRANLHEVQSSVNDSYRVPPRSAPSSSQAPTFGWARSAPVICGMMCLEFGSAEEIQRHLTSILNQSIIFEQHHLPLQRDHSEWRIFNSTGETSKEPRTPKAFFRLWIRFLSPETPHLIPRRQPRPRTQHILNVSIT